MNIMRKTFSNIKPAKILPAFLLATLLSLQALSPSAKATTISAEEKAPSGLPIADIENSVDASIAPHIENGDIPGAVIAVVKNGQIIFQKGYGKADIEQDIPMDASNTVMEAGSVSKLYTWTAIMQLVEQGKLDLDADISAYLPEGFIDRSFSDPVTLKHLMSHNAGYEEHIEGMMPESAETLVSLEEYLSRGTQPKQVFQPGTVTAYSNYSTNLAGYIVERVSGLSFAEYVAQNILDPLDMKRSSFEIRFDLIDNIMQNKAKGYARQDDQWIEQPLAYINDIPAGSLNTTATDMANFMIAQMNYDGSGSLKLFQNPDTLQVFQSKLFSHYDKLAGNAHGFWEYISTGKRVLKHGGNTTGFTSKLLLVPEEQFGVCILTNTVNEMSGSIRDIQDLLIGLPQKASDAAAGLNHAKEVSGTYSTARTIYSNLFAATNVLSNMGTIVSANDQGGIDVSIPALDVQMHFVEVEPYYFERIETENNTWDNAGMSTNRLYFVRNEKGEITQLSFGIISDELRVKPLQSPSLHLYAMIASALIFLIGLVWSIIALIRNMKNTASLALLRGNLASSILGLLNFANLAILMLRLLTDPSQALSNFNLQILLFWVLTVLLWIAEIFSLSRCFNRKSKKNWKLLFVLLTVASLILTAFLIYYHFFKFA